MDFFHAGDDENARFRLAQSYMQQATVEPCPVCGKRRIRMIPVLRLQPNTGLGWFSYYLVCSDCGMASRPRSAMYIAVRTWNNIAKRVRAKIEERQDGEVHD